MSASLACRRLCRPLCIAGVLVFLLLSGCGSRRARPDVAPAAPQKGKVIIATQPPGAALFDETRNRLGSTPLTLERPAGTRLGLQLVKDGYAPHRFSAVFDAGRTLRLELGLTPRQAELVITTGAVMGGQIFVDGEPEGRTPNRIGVQAGVEHLVEIRKGGMESYKEKVTLKPGERRQLVAVLLREGTGARIGVLTLRVNRPASIYLNGKLLGRSPIPPLPLPARAHQLLVKDDRGATVRRRFVLKKGERLELEVDLPRK